MPTMTNALCGASSMRAGSEAIPSAPSADSSTITTAGDRLMSSWARSLALAVVANGSMAGSACIRLESAVRMASWRAAIKTEIELSAMWVGCATIPTSIGQRRALLIRAGR
jgi:hypothetical protein